jgi:hypothetical protein
MPVQNIHISLPGNYKSISLHDKREFNWKMELRPFIGLPSKLRDDLGLSD